MHRYLIYVVRDIGVHARYMGVARYCNKSGREVNARLIYRGFFTKTGLEGFVRYIRLRAGPIWAGTDLTLSNPMSIAPGQCVSMDVEYYVDEDIASAIDSVRLMMIRDGRLFIGGFQFDLVEVG